MRSRCAAGFFGDKRETPGSRDQVIGSNVYTGMVMVSLTLVVAFLFFVVVNWSSFTCFIFNFTLFINLKKWEP